MQRSTVLVFLLSLALLVPVLPATVQAQDRPPERQLRTYIPPDQLVSFTPSTPFNDFIEFINPIFERVTGKEVVDPEDRSDAIGVSISGMYFFDAFELVLEHNGLTHRETERLYVVEQATGEQDVAQAEAGVEQGGEAVQELPAHVGTREIQIDAVLFNLNLTKARELGIDWNTLFGQGGQSGTGGTGGGGTGGGRGGEDRPRFYVETDELFDDIDGITGPDRVEMGTLTQLFRLFERENAGETVANPTVTVQSGETGRIQVGSDVPIQIRDFAGNTVTEFVQTGIIVDVTPTLISEAVTDTAGAPELDFVHMNVQVENSSSSPSEAGPIIDKSTANTQVLLLDGEQTIIGGLYSTDESVGRRGIPLLKDLPPWFFGLRYVFGYEQKNTTQRELLIVLQARVVDPLQTRADRPYEDELLEKRRGEVRESLLRVGEEVYEHGRSPKLEDSGENDDSDRQ